MYNQMNYRKEKVENMYKLLRIIGESPGDIVNNIFKDIQETRLLYCENLYELEKCLKKILEAEHSKRHEN